MRKNRTDKEIFEAIEEFGDLSMADFCELMEIIGSKMKDGGDGRVPMIITDDDLNTDRPSLEISMPDGRYCRFFGQLDPVLISSLM